MAVLILPLRPTQRTPFFEQRTALEGREYVFRFRWNTRRSRWSFDLLDESESRILSGATINTGFDFLERLTDERRPPGKLAAIDVSGASGEADTITGLGGDSPIRMVYVDSESVAELGL